jgi:hypothetical protein
MEAWKAAPRIDLVARIVERYHLEARLDMARMAMEKSLQGHVLLENQVRFRQVMDGEV